MLSTKLYKTVARRGLDASSFAKIHGVVSSIYLLQRLNRLKISVNASATRSSSILAVTTSTVPVTTFFRSSSTGSDTFSLVTTPSKYLLLMEIVRFTRFPRVFAKSELRRSVTNSQEITPSLSKGISWSRKYRTASTPKISVMSSAYNTFPFDLLILPSPCSSQGCPKICFGRGKSSAIKKIGQ